MTFKIEKGIPFDASFKYPYDKMEVGDSFVVPQGQEHSRAPAVCQSYGRRTGKVFRSKKTPDGVRIWRVA